MKTMRSTRSGTVVKENVVWEAPLSTVWVALGAGACALALLAVALVDSALPAPLTRAHADPQRFVAQNAHEHLVNLTSIGPRVAGSYENEVSAVSVLVAAAREVARTASQHQRVEVDLQRASGAFSLAFLDGMTNVYRDVQSVVVRVSGAGAPPARARAHHPRPPRTALLLNCHFDTVPDSPGASDDGAGCAVLLETLRALAAAPRPQRHHAVFLFNGAEENILQASHAFIMQHPWAKSVRAFINIEACGAGGREVLFQAGPHDPWIMEEYAGAVPHPFASSLAQEMFESGLIPADTDFRIFRDFGNLSGVDLAWSANGYVYHTRLDTAERVPAAALQRTGDNVLALARALLASPGLEADVDRSSQQPVFFDVLGMTVLTARAPLAAACVVLALSLAALRIHLNACAASKQLFVGRRAWWRVVGLALCVCGAAHVCGLALGVAPALLLHAAGARLAFYSRPWLLAPLYALPALGGTWLAAASGWQRARWGAGGAAPLLRGWWSARAWADALQAAWGGALAACALRGLRSAFVLLLWTLLPAVFELAAHAARASDGARAACWALGAALPLLETWYLALGSLTMFVPIAGRIGTPPLPADVLLALLASALTLAACSWLLPLVVAARTPHRLAWVALGVCAVSCALVLATPLGAPYSPSRPQRVMLFHTRRTVHAHHRHHHNTSDRSENFFWMPHLDDNTPHAAAEHVAALRAARPTGGEECARWLYCGAPYYLPALSLIAHGHALPAASQPRARLHAHLSAAPLNRTVHSVRLNITGPAHVVVIVSPAPGARVSWCSALDAAPQEGLRWGERRTYFIALHDARHPKLWQLELHIQHAFPTPPARWVELSLAGHSLFGDDKLAPEHAQLAAAFPPHAAVTGWGVDLHLYSL